MNKRQDKDAWRHTVTAGKKMCRGYSTGSCAAAAARAATAMLFSGKPLKKISIDIPAGLTLTLPLAGVEVEAESAGCAVIKDAGDDPDITHGTPLFARARFSKEPGVLIMAGEGIGRVTKPGLQVPVGKPAINPVPEKMIIEAAASELPEGKGVIIELSLPEGERLARKTMNARLGVVGGLSILGTSGLVEPMSEKSYEDTLALELKTVSREWKGTAVLVTGNYGRNLALEYFALPEESVVKIGNLVGFALDRCRELEFKKILLVGHIGKLIKVVAGIFNTHSRIADARFETFAARAALLGADHDTILKLREAVTTEDMVDILGGLGGKDYFDQLAAEVSERASAFLYGEMYIGTVLFNFRRGLLGCDQRARDLLEEFK